MTRSAWTMQLKPGCEAEYRRRHDAIWPELSEVLRSAGISDYSIFLDPDSGKLFAVQKLAEDHQSAALVHDPIVRRWWDSMADLMETKPDHEPVCNPLREVFYLK